MSMWRKRTSNYTDRADDRIKIGACAKTCVAHQKATSRCNYWRPPANNCTHTIWLITAVHHCQRAVTFMPLFRLTRCYKTSCVYYIQRGLLMMGRVPQSAGDKWSVEWTHYINVYSSIKSFWNAAAACDAVILDPIGFNMDQLEWKPRMLYYIWMDRRTHPSSMEMPRGITQSINMATDCRRNPFVRY